MNLHEKKRFDEKNQTVEEHTVSLDNNEDLMSPIPLMFDEYQPEFRVICSETTLNSFVQLEKKCFSLVCSTGSSLTRR